MSVTTHMRDVGKKLLAEMLQNLDRSLGVLALGCRRAARRLGEAPGDGGHDVLHHFVPVFRFPVKGNDERQQDRLVHGSPGLQHCHICGDIACRHPGLLWDHLRHDDSQGYRKRGFVLEMERD